MITRKNSTTKILYLFAEGSRASIRRRLFWVCRGLGVSVDSIRDRLLLSPRPQISLDNPEDLEALKVRIKSIGKDLIMVFLDTLSDLHAGGENQRDEMAPILNALSQMAEELGFTIVLVHHSTKPDKHGNFDPLRGSGAFRGWHDALLYFSPADVATEDRQLCGEFRDAESFKGIAVRLEVREKEESARIVLDGTAWASKTSPPPPAPPIHKYVLDRLSAEGPLTRSALRCPPGKKFINGDTIKKALANLQQQDKVRPLDPPRRGQRWEIVPSEEERGS